MYIERERDKVAPEASRLAGEAAPYSTPCEHSEHFSSEPFRNHPGVELRANLKSISHRCHLFVSSS